jgi:hypothetical protein
MNYRRNSSVDYHAFFAGALDRLHAERRYRVFADLQRIAGRFPHAIWHSPDGAEERSDLVLERLSRHGPASESDRRRGRDQLVRKVAFPYQCETKRIYAAQISRYHLLIPLLNSQSTRRLVRISSGAPVSGSSRVNRTAFARLRTLESGNLRGRSAPHCRTRPAETAIPARLIARLQGARIGEKIFLLDAELKQVVRRAKMRARSGRHQGAYGEAALVRIESEFHLGQIPFSIRWVCSQHSRTAICQSFE